MIYLLYGDDTRRSRALLRDFENRFQNEVPLLWHRIDARQEGADDVIMRTVRARSLFSEKSYLVFLYSSELSNASKTIVGENIKRWAVGDSVVLFYEEGVPKSDPLFKKLLKSVSKKQEFHHLTGVPLERWVDGELKKCKAVLPVQKKRFLIERYGGDLWKLSLELDKAILGYEIGAEKALLSEKDLFLVGDLWGSRERERAFLVYQRLLASGFGADQIFRTLFWHVRTMLLVACKETKGIHPFVARKASLQLKNFTRGAIVRAYESLLMLDVGEKLGRGSMEFGLCRFFLTL